MRLVDLPQCGRINGLPRRSAPNPRAVQHPESLSLAISPSRCRCPSRASTPPEAEAPIVWVSVNDGPRLGAQENDPLNPRSRKPFDQELLDPPPSPEHADAFARPGRWIEYGLSMKKATAIACNRTEQPRSPVPTPPPGLAAPMCQIDRAQRSSEESRRRGCLHARPGDIPHICPHFVRIAARCGDGTRNPAEFLDSSISPAKRPGRLSSCRNRINSIPRPRLTLHVLVIEFRCLPGTRLSLHRSADMSSSGSAPLLRVPGPGPR